MAKKGGDFEILAIDFLEKIFKEINYTVVRKRVQNSGSQDGYDTLLEVVNSKYRSYCLYSECKDYTTDLNYSDAIIKIPQIISTHKEIDLILFISPKRNFNNIFEETRNKPFLENLDDRNYKVAVLSPETNVQKYLSLYPEIYNQIYLCEPQIITQQERQEILNQFDKFIFSSKNLNKIIIDESDRETFIKGLQKDSFHINRTVRKSQNREYNYFNKDVEENSLINAIKKTKHGLVLLGNPGYGKSCELRQLAINLWENRNQNDIIPILYILKNFSSDSTIENFLPSNYKLIHNLVVILDGIDEIENIIDFSNKLRNFIFQNADYIKTSNMKFLISCRTNVYKKYVKNINDFEICFLDEVDSYTAIKFLIEKYNLDIREQKNFDVYKNRELLENPFYLDLVGKNYKNNKILLINKSKLINEFVQSRLIEDKEDKYQNDIDFDVEKIISYTQKIAFTLEAMQKPSLTPTEIKRVINVNEKEFSKNPFLEENFDGSWSFVHKNIQEYFVSILLQNLSFDEIINFVKIDNGINKVHPTWYNVITFLLNLELDENVYNELVKWLLDNDFELLFNADTNRISDEIKSSVLQDFFSKKCVEETLWINDVKEVAGFSESEANIRYLIEKIKDTSIHRRARMSAIKLISYMEINDSFHSDFKELILIVINENDFVDENNLYLKQDAIMLTESLGINDDVSFFDTIILNLKDYDNKEIISSIIHSVPNKSIENNIYYFLDILDKSIGNKNWKVVSKYNSVTSTKESLFNLFERIDNPDILLKIYSFLIERHKNHQVRESLIKDFLKHLETVFKDKTEYHQDLIEKISNAVINDYIRHFEDDLLIDLINACDIGKQVFYKILYSISGNSYSKHFLADIVKREYFDEILERYNEKILNDEFVQQFRNVISHHNIKLAIEFEKIVETKTGYRFIDKIDVKEINERTEYWKTKEQNNFNVLFDEKELINQITKIYEFLNKEELCFTDIDKFYHKYYDNFELQKEVTENAKHLLYEILRDYYQDNEKLNIKDISLALSKAEINVMNDILNSIPKENKSNNLVISEIQTEHIRDWCFKNTEKANYNYTNYLIPNGGLDWEEYNLFKVIYEFQKIYKFNLDETLLLNMLWFNPIEKEIFTDYMIDYVEPEKITQRVLENLEKGIDEKLSFCNHIKYCVENSINFKHLNIDLKSKVYELLNNDSYYYATELLEICFVKDVKTLKEFVNYKDVVKNRSNFLDNIFKLLENNNESQFIEQYLTENYCELIKDEIYQETELIRKLISFNNPDIFEKLFNLLNNRVKNSIKGEVEFRHNEWQKYTNRAALNSLVKILELYIATPNADDLFGTFYTPIRVSTETIINICKNNDAETCLIVLEELEKMDFERIKESNGELFYYNKTKNDVLEIYYNHKSKPFPFKQVLDVLNANKYLFFD